MPDDRVRVNPDTRANAPTVEWGPKPSPHALMAHYDGGYWSVTVTCPDAHLGAERPCAVWEDGDGTTRQNACTFQQYASDLDPEEWLHGRHDFGPVMVVERASGDEWHAGFAVVFVCPNGCKVYGSSSSERVGHFCRKTNRIAGKHAWLYAYPPKEI